MKIILKYLICESKDEDAKFINIGKKRIGKFVGIDTDWLPGKRAFVFKDIKAGEILAIVKTTGSYSKYNPFEVYHYEGHKFSKEVKPKTSNEKIQNTFTNAWDDFFYSDDYDDSNSNIKTQHLKLVNAMKKHGWKLLGTVSKVGINNLNPNDAITESDDNEFYQFVLTKDTVQTPGGRNITKLNSNSVNSNSMVWRKQ
jgi:hypothetical protein